MASEPDAEHSGTLAPGFNARYVAARLRSKRGHSGVRPLKQESAVAVRARRDEFRCVVLGRFMSMRRT